MKRFMFIGLMLIAAIGLNAQSYSVKMVLSTSNNLYYTGVTADNVSGTTAKNYDFMINRDYVYLYNIQVALDTQFVAGNNPNASIQIYGSDDDVTYYTVGSAQTFYGSVDTTLRFNNLSASSVTTNASHTETNASHTETTAAATDYRRGFVDARDTLGSGGAADYLVDDTISVAQRVNTVAAQTVTVAAQTLTTAEGGVMWKFIRVTVTGASSTAKYGLDHITINVAKKEN